MDKTIIENDATVRENPHLTDITQREGINTYINDDSRGHLIQFKDYNMIRQLPTTGGEADIYIVSKNETEYILKLYRHEMKPTKEMVERLVHISNQFPEDIIRIYEIAKDEKLNRWYELQEFAELGSLKNLISNDHSFVVKNIHKIVEEITLILKTIHNENIIHRDIKPDNILVRTKEPLDLIITDFGISSVLDEEMSKKMTSKSGTRIYFAPESFSGVIGKEVDYWALGMILLEILEEGNIFSGINEGMIAHEIFTKGIKIPSTISVNLQLLLKGLLTRDPKQRWNHEQIFKWLAGDKNIPTFHTYDESEVPDIKPYIFENEKFFDIKNLITKMYSDEYYEKAKAHILRGYVTKWLEDTGQYDNAIVFALDKKINIDLNIFNIYNHFIQANDFIFMGKLITIKNLLKFMDETGNKEFLKYVRNGTIFEAYTRCISRNKFEKNNDLYDFLLKSKLCKNDTETHYLGRIYLETNSLAYQLVKNDTNNELIQHEAIKNIFYHFCNTDWIYPKSLIENIQKLDYHFEFKKGITSIYLKGWSFEITDEADDLKFLLNHSDLEKAYQFMQTTDAFQELKSPSFEDFINEEFDPETYMILINLKRKLAFEHPKTYLFIVNEIANQSFIDDIQEYVPGMIADRNKIFSDISDINVFLTKEELFAFEQLIRRVQSEIRRAKEIKKKEEEQKVYWWIGGIGVAILAVWLFMQFWQWILGIGLGILLLMAMFGGS